MTDGIINVNKPAGWTSQDVCAKLRHVLHIRKIGHTGTLDPMATGVLPVCVGKATRIIEYYDRDSKSYRASMKLGITTDTLDITGEVLETAGYSEVDEKAVREAFKAYTGHVMQIPPKYSALKIDGKRAYDLAREGKDFEIKAREIIIYDNSITRIDLEAGEIEFDVTCSKGTYIRTLCADIGNTLGVGATMTALVRTKSAMFNLDSAKTLDEIRAIAENDDVKSLIIPTDAVFADLPEIHLDGKRTAQILNGMFLTVNFADDQYRVYGNEGDFLCVGNVENGILKIVKNFYAGN